jgi:hypothetical protein
MKRLLLFAALLCAVTLAIGSSFVSSASKAGQKQRASMTFTEPVKLQGILLKGEYLFVHDDAAMMRGEACTFVYKGSVETARNLVTSFHCIPANRAKVGNFTVRTGEPTPGVVEVREFQFAGETESHLVPPVKAAPTN